MLGKVPYCHEATGRTSHGSKWWKYDVVSLYDKVSVALIFLLSFFRMFVFTRMT